jgi:hypothetical protein
LPTWLIRSVRGRQGRSRLLGYYEQLLRTSLYVFLWKIFHFCWINAYEYWSFCMIV